MPTLESIAGIKLAPFIAGILGSLTTLSYLPALTPFQRFSGFLAGLGVAIYVPPLALAFLKLPDTLSGPLAYVCGVFGFGLIAAAIAISKDPIGAWRRFRGMDGGNTGSGG